MSLIVRNAELNDVNNLTSLMYEYIVGFYQKPWPGDGKIHQLIQTLLEKQVGIQFIAEKDGKPVGFATLYFAYSTMKANPITIMNDFFIIESCRDTEMEIQLFLACQNFTKNQGYAYMSWITAVGNTRAQQFFDKMGATQGEWINFSL